MADCSKTEVFFEELDRMCKTVNKYGEAEDCVFYKPNYGCCGYMHWLPDGVEKAVTVLQKWSDEHPRKTRQSEFLKMYPNAMLCEGEYLNIAPCHLDRNIRKGCLESCINCHREYWLAEVEQMEYEYRIIEVTPYNSVDKDIKKLDS